MLVILLEFMHYSPLFWNLFIDCLIVSSRFCFKLQRPLSFFIICIAYEMKCVFALFLGRGLTVSRYSLWLFFYQACLFITRYEYSYTSFFSERLHMDELKSSQLFIVY